MGDETGLCLSLGLSYKHATGRATMPSNRQHSTLEDLPLELLQQILSLLDIPTLKWLSLASSILRAVLFP